MQPILTKPMFAVCGLVVIILAATSISTGTSVKTELEYNPTRLKRSIGNERIRVCTSPACVSQSTIMKLTMDPSLDPCRNFYQYACAGRWSSAKINSESNFIRLEVEHHLTIKKILEQPTRFLLSEVERRAQRYYQSCLKMINTPEESKVGPGKVLQRLLRRIGGWPIADEIANINRDDYFLTNQWNFQEAFNTIHSVLNIGTFFNWTLQVPTKIVTNSVYPGRPTIKIDHDGLTLNDRNDYLSSTTLNYTFTNLVAKVMAAFLTKSDSSSFIEGPDFLLVVNDIIEVETRLAQITPPSHTYVFVTSIADLNLNAPFIEWHQFFQSEFSQVNVDITPSHNVLVSSLDFLRELSLFVNQLLTTDRGQMKLRNYLAWHVTFHHFKILEKIWDKRKANAANLWNDCVIDTAQAMDFAVAAMYVRRRLDSESSKHLAESMTNSIKESFKENLKNMDWLDEETSTAVKDKVDVILNWIGYPQFLKNATKLEEIYRDLDFKSNDYFTNNARLEQHSFRSKLATLDKPVDKSEWDSISYSVLPSFAQGSNVIKLHIGILRKPFFDVTFPSAYNFGSIGAVIGHEMVHGFDNEGRKHDSNGILRQWWNSAAIERFEKRAECFKWQYSNFTVKGHPIDGEQTLAENIADSSGVKTAFNAFKTWISTRDYVLSLPGMSFAQDQLFFLSYAQSFCSKKSEDENLGSTYSHSPDSYRVIGSLSNMPEFSLAFQCPPGSSMNPIEKCEIW